MYKHFFTYTVSLNIKVIKSHNLLCYSNKSHKMSPSLKLYTLPVIFYHQFDQLNPPKINQPSFNYNSDSLWSLTEIRESEKAELLSEILSLKWKVTLSN